MPKIPESFNFGDRENVTPEKLLEMMEDMYQQLSTNINQKPNVFQRKVGDTPIRETLK